MRKTVVLILSVLTGSLIGASMVGKMNRKKIKRIEAMSGKHLALFLMANQWIKIKQEKKELATYLEENGYKKIAIYGMSYAGQTLLEELNATNIEVLYGIDKRADSLYSEIDVFSMNDELEKVDAIIVTAITFFDEIEEQLKEKFDCPILSLEDILYEI